MNAALFAHLQAFLVVARTGSFTVAARELGVTRSAVSHSVRQLEEHLGTAVLRRTTRSVAVTEAGRQLVASAGPAMSQSIAALAAATARPGETIGRVRLSVVRSAAPFVIEPVVAEFRRRHPRIEVEVSLDDRVVDVVAEGYDAGVRTSEAIERDMVQVRLTDPFRFIVVASPAYLARRGTPQRPEDLLKHDCITFRSPTTGALYAWELEKGRRSWRVPVRGGVVTNDGPLNLELAERGAGLSYAFEPAAEEKLRARRLHIVLEPYAATVPGFFLYYPSVAQRSVALQLFVEAAKDLALGRKRRSR